MKRSVVGFSQEKLIGLGLDYTHAAVLDWFVCYRDTSKAPATVMDGCVWYVVLASQVEADLPILGLKRRAIQARMADLVKAGVFASAKFGAATCYRLSDAYSGLVDDDDVPRQGAHDGAHLDGEAGSDAGAHEDAQVRTEMPECARGCASAHGGAQSRTVARTSDPSPKKESFNPLPEENYPHSSKEELPPRAVPQAKKFTPPSVDEVGSYCSERQNGVDPQSFVDFYASKGWVVGKSPMKDWKAAVRTWERRDGRDRAKPKVDQRDLGSAAQWDAYKEAENAVR